MSRVFKADNLTVSGSFRPQLMRAKETIRESPAQSLEKELSGQLQAAKNELQDAKIQAKIILEKAEKEVAAKKEEAYREGWDAGHAAGLAQGKDSWQEKLARLEAMRSQLIKKDADWLQESGREIVEMALAVFERVFVYKLRHEDEAVQAALAQVLKSANGARRALLMVAPEDFDHLWQERDKWKALLPTAAEFKIERDLELKKGDLVLNTNQGIVDARVSTVCAQVAAQLSPGQGQ